MTTRSRWAAWAHKNSSSLVGSSKNLAVTSWVLFGPSPIWIPALAQNARTCFAARSEKALASAFTSLEAARIEAQRQQLYLETIAQPNLADYPLYPKRIVSFGMVLASCLLVYGIAWLLVASAREHVAA